MQRTNNSQDNLEEKEVGRFILPDIKAYYKATVIKKECGIGIKIDDV